MTPVRLGPISTGDFERLREALRTGGSARVVSVAQELARKVPPGPEGGEPESREDAARLAARIKRAAGEARRRRARGRR